MESLPRNAALAIVGSLAMELNVKIQQASYIGDVLDALEMCHPHTLVALLTI